MMKFISRGLCLVAALVFLFPAQPATAQDSSAQAQERQNASGQRIDEIKIIGTQRIEPSTVMTYLEVRVGDYMTEETLDRALKSLFATEFFADVKLQQAGHTIEVHVSENPIINQIAFEGNHRIKKDELVSEVQLKPRHVFTRNKVQADVNRLYQVYQRQGRFAVSIDPKIIELDQNRVNLVFEIDEGPQTKVGSIRFVGNERYDDDKLRSVVTTKEERWYRFWTSDDRYDPDRLSYDQELLRRFYMSQGYVDFRVISANAELSRDRQGFYVTYTLEEGDRYRIGNVSVNSQLHNFDAKRLDPFVFAKSGDWYDADDIQKSIEKMTDALGDMQYAFVSIRPDIQRHRDTKIVDIAFQINETPRVFVERIDISGNVRTLDKVIRRQILLAEGDPFSKSKLAKSEQKIKDMGFFEDVKVTPAPGSSPDKSVVNVEVSEQSTGELSVGAGFSTSDGPLIDMGIKERNLLGTGRELGLSSTIAGKRTEFNIAFTEPYFMERDFSVGVNAFHRTQDMQIASSFSQKRTGGGLNFGFPLSEKWREAIGYRIENNQIMNVQGNASNFVKQQEGITLTSAVSQQLTYDDRDSKLFPTSGLYSWFSTDMAGLGGDAHYLQGKLGGTYYYPVADNWVFDVLGETGAIMGLAGDDVRINQRFFLGAQNLRGFKTAGVGPRDRVTNDSLGGNYFYRGSAELSFPVGLPKEMGVKGYAFSDVGSLWGLDGTPGISIVDENKLRGSAGVGISWRSPLGPIRMDMAVPYMNQTYDQTQFFNFNFGTRF